jgi:hypothetical protein
MNIAPRVIPTMSTVVKTEPRTIFMRLAPCSEAAEGRIAQLSEKQNVVSPRQHRFESSA